MKRAYLLVVAAFFLGTALFTAALYGASIFTQDRQLRQVSDVRALESGLVSSCQRICSLAQMGQAIKAQWAADVAAGNLDQASVDELNAKIAEAAAVVTAATAYRDAHQ